ncbi:MAG TPA: serine hydroxymethyltransferase [Candidatus Enterosoma merdigallinarum]|nr:serine hydroxymethyltransferase [Candidatus Enterosoma merdigallinarum]
MTEIFDRNLDDEVFDAIDAEVLRQQESTELIASENFVSLAVLKAQGSVMTNKYAEGYPGKRYYGGCVNVDRVEELARERLKALFHVRFVNVQPYSGSAANMAAIRSLLSPGDRIMGMSVNGGGHLTHGYSLSFSGKDYESLSYDVDRETYRLDYDAILRQAQQFKPKLIICGASAYSREIDFKKFKEIADSVGAYLMADIAHIAGLVATGYHNSPIDVCDVVTSTTHKTLRGPRGGIIMTNDEELSKKIDKNVFPGIQGGPLEHVIAAKAVAFKEDLTPEYKDYIGQVVKNAKRMSEEFSAMGYDVITGGTDNHLFMLDVLKSKNITGMKAQKVLEAVNITANRNSIPFDTQKPYITSGIRIGTPAMTTRGFQEKEFVQIAHYIDEAIRNQDDARALDAIREKVVSLNRAFPLPYRKVG